MNTVEDLWLRDEIYVHVDDGVMSRPEWVCVLDIDACKDNKGCEYAKLTVQTATGEIVHLNAPWVSTILISSWREVQKRASKTLPQNGEYDFRLYCRENGEHSRKRKKNRRLGDNKSGSI